MTQLPSLVGIRPRQTLSATPWESKVLKHEIYYSGDLFGPTVRTWTICIRLNRWWAVLEISSTVLWVQWSGYLLQEWYNGQKQNLLQHYVEVLQQHGDSTHKHILALPLPCKGIIGELKLRDIYKVLGFCLYKFTLFV